MKPISVLVAVVSIAALAAACKRDQPQTSETNTTGGQVEPEAPSTEPVKPLPVEPQVPSGGPTGATTGSTTDSTTTDQSGMRSSGANSRHKGRDSGVASDYPTGGSDLMDRDKQDQRDRQDRQKGKSQEDTGKSNATEPGTTPGGQHKGASMSTHDAGATDTKNHSTSLGDGKSGQYTDGKGTYGGKATWGTGPHNDTKMDQPTK